jgi:uncharacterized protein
MNTRIRGYDLARSLAIFGMVIVNFTLVMSATAGSKLLINFAHLFQGRAVAIFVVLAGVGITLFTKNRADSARASLLKRAALLIIIGLLFTPVWPADILHFYGFYFIVGAFLIKASSRVLWLSILFFVLSFPVLLLFFDYETAWNFKTFAYLDFWTIKGMVRHVFFNGFHPVFPWTAFLLLGMWLARQDLFQSAVRMRLMIVSISVWIASELLSDQLIKYFDEAAEVLGTSPMPPTPLYLLAGGSLAVFIIVGCVWLAFKFSTSRVLSLLCKTGEMSLSLYVLHVVLGMGILGLIGKLENQTIEFSLMCSFLFCLVGIIFANLWGIKFKQGPLEWVFRKLGK